MGHMSSRKQDKETKHTKTMNWEKPNRKRRQSEGQVCPSSPRGLPPTSQSPQQSLGAQALLGSTGLRKHAAALTVWGGPTLLLGTYFPITAILGEGRAGCGLVHGSSFGGLAKDPGKSRA